MNATNTECKEERVFLWQTPNNSAPALVSGRGSKPLCGQNEHEQRKGKRRGAQETRSFENHHQWPRPSFTPFELDPVIIDHPRWSF